MLYELRTYTVKPGTLGDIVKAASTVSRDVRGDNYGKLEGYWFTEIGPLNQVMHMWSYESYDERTRLRGELAKNPRWNGEYIPLIRPDRGAPGHPPAQCHQGARGPGILRQYLRIAQLSRQSRRPGQAVDRGVHCGAAGAREYSKIVGLWQTEAGQPNEVCHIWAYPDLNARAKARGDSLKDPVWQDFLSKGPGSSRRCTRPSCCRHRTPPLK